jgi:hypothetical protein
MFVSLFSENKLTDIDFRDPEKFRSIPSLALPAICLLDEYLTCEMCVFEWGSGASTSFFAQRVGGVVSIEHDPRWFAKVGEAMDYRLLDANRQLITPGEGFDADHGSYQQGYETVNFRDYVHAIDSFPDNHFNAILVDGRARCACLDHAIPKLRDEGILLLDDSARSIYQWAISKIKWPVRHLEGCIPFYRHGHTVRTTIWRKG